VKTFGGKLLQILCESLQNQLAFETCPGKKESPMACRMVGMLHFVFDNKFIYNYNINLTSISLIFMDKIQFHMTSSVEYTAIYSILQNQEYGFLKLSLSMNQSYVETSKAANLLGG
jgi:hypothetical protein